MNELLGYSVPLWAVLAYWFSMAAISNMPTPREGERFYSWVFGTLQTALIYLTQCPLEPDNAY